MHYNEFKQMPPEVPEFEHVHPQSMAYLKEFTKSDDEKSNNEPNQNLLPEFDFFRKSKF